MSVQPEPVTGWLRPLAEHSNVVVGETPEDLAPALQHATALLLWGHPPLPFGRYLDLAPELRWVHSSGAGVEELVVPELLARRITLTNSHGLYSNAVAELALALMLGWAKRLPTRLRAQHEHRWEQGFTHRMRGATLVVLGLGSIGTALARSARGLEMNVVGVRRTARPSRYASEVVTLADLDDVLPRAEYLAICCPDTPETHGLLGRRELALLPPGAFVVNVARGSVIDESALIDALRSGHLGGAGLDVFQQEPLQADSPLWDLPEVLVSPHFPNTANYQQDTLRLFLDNLERFRSGRRLRNVVNVRRGY